jgi:hypothetical protein
VSLLLRDELRVVLCREKLQLVRIRSRLTRKGWQYIVLGKDDFALEQDVESPWKSAIDMLATEILRLTSKPKLVRVVLSNHFLRYAIVDVDQSIRSKAEQVAFVKHRFVQTYGEAAESWELRLDQECPGAPYLASAVDGTMLFEIREIFAEAQIRLQSIQPCLMTAYNQSQSKFADKNAWFVLFEDGNLCIVWLKAGHPSAIRTIRAGEDWMERLPEIIDRESLFSNCDTNTKDIFLWSTDPQKIAAPAKGDWKIDQIKLAIPPGLVSQYDENFALAMCG